MAGAALSRSGGAWSPAYAGERVGKRPRSPAKAGAQARSLWRAWRSCGAVGPRPRRAPGNRLGAPFPGESRGPGPRPVAHAALVQRGGARAPACAGEQVRQNAPFPRAGGGPGSGGRGGCGASSQSWDLGPRLLGGSGVGIADARLPPLPHGKGERETAGALACLVQAEGFAGFSSRESLHRRRSPDTARSSRSRSGLWGAEIDAISVGADTWLSAGLRVAREAASRCWPG